MRLTTSLLLTILLIVVGGHACADGTSATKGDPKEEDGVWRIARYMFNKTS